MRARKRGGCFGNSDSSAGITDQIPSDEVLIAPVKGIGERALNRMCPDQIEELSGTVGETGDSIFLHVRQYRVLIRRREFREIAAF